jgi:preprotein translocase subunit SecF
MEERSKLQKAVLISMAAMVVLFGILTLISHVRKGVEFEGGLLRRTETEESVIYNGKVRGEQVEITVRAAGSGNLTEVDFRIGNRIQDDCTLETGLPPIQAEQLGPVEHIRITKTISFSLRAAMIRSTAWAGTTWTGTGIPLPCPFPIATLLGTITGSIMKRIEGRFSALPVGRSW